ncbi:MAG: (d)CMP kinase [candidate division Zixibacteria bacterium]|nr:(d)CMP kinase [candidate division Zixibacteria bacterium]MDH3937812.1 (d)CMP kinase [candidate division Zixibacteria bacterium]MDH4033113.1 (d)CMP kinase [candidate division Zixibacteria bacterium]
MSESVLHLARLKGKIIAIDGPAGSGKSTTSRMLAARLGYTYLDTGAMYRAITWFALKAKIELSDADKLGEVAQKMPLEFKTEDEVNRVLVGEHDVTSEIRSVEVTKHVSEVSAHKTVREAMVARQRQMARNGSIVAEGRDTTTVVFPRADIKIYLDADTRTRARRRLLDLSHMGVSTTVEEQEADIIRRDKYDSGRAHSPLTKAKDAYTVDTSNLTIEGQVDQIIALIRSVIK